VAELKTGRYTPRETTWAKIKNPNYSQAEGRGGVVRPHRSLGTAGRSSVRIDAARASLSSRKLSLTGTVSRPDTHRAILG
jgi:hypothetical protein